ncbi:hypothetical protein MJO29_013903, partial [Puccinia striiformis f. sp. tritici]
ESQVSFHLLCRSTAENNPLLTPHLISYGPQVKAKTVQWLDDGLTPNEVNTRLDVGPWPDGWTCMIKPNVSLLTLPPTPIMPALWLRHHRPPHPIGQATRGAYMQDFSDPAGLSCLYCSVLLRIFVKDTLACVGCRSRRIHRTHDAQQVTVTPAVSLNGLVCSVAQLVPLTQLDFEFFLEEV